MKKVIIAGSRTLLPSVGFIERSLRMVGLTDNQYRIISGNAYGVDQVGEALAKESGWPFEIFPADWETHGKSAGPIRNKEMAHYADILLLIWDGKSKGSLNMKKNMLNLGKPVHEIIIKRDWNLT